MPKGSAGVRIASCGVTPQAQKTGTSPGEVRQAVRKAGNGRGKVEAALKK